MAQKKKSPKKDPPPQQFTGRAVWTVAEDNSEGTISHAVDRGAELAVDSGGRYTVLLRRSELSQMTLTGSAAIVGEPEAPRARPKNSSGTAGVRSSGPGSRTANASIGG